MTETSGSLFLQRFSERTLPSGLRSATQFESSPLAREKIRTFVDVANLIRVLPSVTLLAVGGFNLWYLKENDDTAWVMVVLSLVTLLYTGIFAAFERSPDDLNYVVTNQLLCDVAMITLVVLYSGGLDSLFSILFVGVIMFSGLAVDQASSYLIATACSTGLGLVTVVQGNQLLGFVKPPAGGLEGALSIFLFNTTLFFGTGLLANIFSNLLRRSWADLAEEQASLEELRGFTDDVMISIQSGLITTNDLMEINTYNLLADQLLEPIVGDLSAVTSTSEIFGGQIEEVFRDILYGDQTEIRPIQVWLKAKHAEDWFFMDITCTKLRHHTGDIRGLLITFQDRTELKRLEGQIQEQEQLSTVGQMAAGIAHEIRNPLGAITGSIEMLYNELDLDGLNKELMEIIIREGRRLNTLVQEFLDYARPQALTMIPVELTRLVQDVRVLVQGQFQRDKKPITIETHFHEDPLWIEGDPDKLKQVFWNLALNACQIMPGKGRLIISSGFSGKPPALPNREMIGQVALLDSPGEEFVRLAFTDSGPGIDPSHLQKIFQPFQSKRAGGVGLGLATCKKIIESHGGAIHVSSVLKQGTTFFVYLPNRKPFEPDSEH